MPASPRKMTAYLPLYQSLAYRETPDSVVFKCSRSGIMIVSLSPPPSADSACQRPLWTEIVCIINSCGHWVDRAFFEITRLLCVKELSLSSPINLFLWNALRVSHQMDFSELRYPRRLSTHCPRRHSPSLEMLGWLSLKLINRNTGWVLSPWHYPSMGGGNSECPLSTSKLSLSPCSRCIRYSSPTWIWVPLDVWCSRGVEHPEAGSGQPAIICSSILGMWTGSGSLNMRTRFMVGKQALNHTTNSRNGHFVITTELILHLRMFAKLPPPPIGKESDTAIDYLLLFFFTSPSVCVADQISVHPCCCYIKVPTNLRWSTSKHCPRCLRSMGIKEIY